MTTVPRRLGVKFSLKREPSLKPDDILPIFQRWIQEHRIEGMLIDVIDYKHVPDGPGIVLIADEADIAYDLTDGEIGLHVITQAGSARRLVRSAAACRQQRAGSRARAGSGSAGRYRIFDFSAAKISFLDRMNYRNEPAVFEQTRDVLTDLAERYLRRARDRFLASTTTQERYSLFAAPLMAATSARMPSPKGSRSTIKTISFFEQRHSGRHRLELIGHSEFIRGSAGAKAPVQGFP